MLIRIIGMLGTGKTLFLTYLCKVKKRQKYIVWANFKNVYADRVASLEELLLDLEDRQEWDSNFKNVKIMLAVDELGRLLKAKDWHSSENEIISKIIVMSRKLNVDIVYTTQHKLMVDVEIRRITEMSLEMSFDLDNDKVYADVYEKHSMGYLYSNTLGISKASNYFDDFNTYEIINPNVGYIIDTLTKRIKNNLDCLKMLKKCDKDSDRIDVISYYLKVTKKTAKLINIAMKK